MSNTTDDKNRQNQEARSNPPPQLGEFPVPSVPSDAKVSVTEGPNTTGLNPLGGQLNKPADVLNTDPSAGEGPTEVHTRALGSLAPGEAIPDQHLPQDTASPPGTNIYDLHQGEVPKHPDGRPGAIFWRGRAKPVGSVDVG